MKAYILENASNGTNTQIASWVVSVIIWTATGFIANYLYLKKAERIVTKAVKNKTDLQTATNYVRKKGGTSYLFLALIIAVILAFFVSNNYIEQ